jgi:hypothetical protein
LDDRHAVAAVLAMKADDVPNVRKVKSPKEALEELWQQSERCEESVMLVLAEIAVHVNSARCVHAGKTGFEGFRKEVQDELRHLTDQTKPSTE